MANIKFVFLLLLATDFVTCTRALAVFFKIHRLRCMFKRCPPNTRCILVNNTAVCSCPKSCDRRYSPVCGNNWKTYNNYCQLVEQSCKDKSRRLRLLYYGTCAAGSCRRTRWSHMVCPYYSVCQIQKGLPRCVCPAYCTGMYKPVCGSDRRTYRNLCELKRIACQKRRIVVAEHKGNCRPDPCAKKECCCGGECRLNEKNEAVCTCNFFCRMVYELPVCGSDGRTYGSACSLRAAACARQDPTLRSGVGCWTTRNTTITTTPSPCENRTCDFFAKCEVINGTATCVCPSSCSPNTSAVCGSNGVTYNNRCELQRDSCNKRQTIGVVKRVPCYCPIPRICLVYCNKKECAKNGGICCCRGCGFGCTKPIKRFGRSVCPPTNDTCSQNSDCPNGKVCCVDGCIKQCLTPIVSGDEEIENK